VGKLVEKLTNRELEVLFWLARGFTGREIAGQLNISVRTVDGHRQSLRGKLNMQTRAQLTEYAIAIGLIRQEDAREDLTP
jgi:DNA-binding CsgD family transcriptional regulator